MKNQLFVLSLQNRWELLLIVVKLMNRRQKAQTVVGAIALILIVIWLLTPVSFAAKILGIVANALILTSMVLSYIAEEKKKKG